MASFRALRISQQLFLVGLLFVGLSILATWPIISDPVHASVIRPDDNDFRLNTYLIFWGAHALQTSPLALHHTNMFHPERYTFAYADIMLAHSVLMMPVIAAFYEPILTYNLFLLASLTIGGMGFFLLARQVTGHPSAAAFGAVIWAFNPVHFTRYQQIQLFGDHWLPWLAWALWVWLQPPSAEAAEEAEGARGRAKSLRWPLMAALFFILNALSGSHIAVFGALTSGAIVLYFVVYRGLWWDREFLVGLSVFAVITVIVLGPVFWPYVMLEEALADKRAETLDLPNASLVPLEFFSARSHFYLWLDGAAGWPAVLNPSGRELRTYAFPGIVAILLAILGVADSSARTHRWLWLACVAFFVFLAMGAYGGYLVVGNLPLVRLIRVPTRFMAPAVFALAVLASCGAASLTVRLRGRRTRLAVFALIGLSFAAEASHAPLRTWEYDGAPLPINEFLADQPGDFAVVQFPLGPDNYAMNVRQVFDSIYHWKKLLVGYSGYQSDENIRLLGRIRDRFPDNETLDELLDLDVRFVIVSPARVDTELIDAIEAQPRLSLSWRYEELWWVYEVAPTPR